ncbi:MAG: hypothetical protein OXG55_08925 [bacterium]|nr:hypothetical protein [bacterium]
MLKINRRADGCFDVVTEAGTVVAEHVVNAAGCYAPQVAGMVGLTALLANVLHSYLITGTAEEFSWLEHELPVVRDDYISGYVRQEQQSGLIGIYEQHGAEAAWIDGPDWSLESPLFAADFDRIGFWLARAYERVPLFEELGIR